MSVSVDTVYQKVLALANKEQRGYVTPQEFNILADKVQNEIFDSYFHDMKTVDLKPKSNLSSSDEMELLQQKLQLYKKYTDVSISSNVNLFDLPANAHYLEGVVDKNSTTGEVKPVVELSTEEIIYTENNPLTKATKNRRVFERRTASSGLGSGSCKIFPTPTEDITLEVRYYKKPNAPVWGYVVVRDTAMYNSNTSRDFSLHDSEEELIVSKILALSGLIVMKPDLINAGGGMEGAISQSKND
jgi:hypothetical protein